MPLEKLHLQWFHDKPFEETLQFITDFHQAISTALEMETNACLWHHQIETLRRKLGNIDKDSFDASYDQIIPFGEIISTSLLHDYWNKIALNHQFIMATDFVITDNLHRESRVQWEATQKNYWPKKQRQHHTYTRIHRLYCKR